MKKYCKLIKLQPIKEHSLALEITNMSKLLTTLKDKCYGHSLSNILFNTHSLIG